MCLLAIIAGVLVGCGGNPEELRSATQSREFVGDIARGGKVGDWKLGSDAATDAIRAWRDRTTIQGLGVGLGERLRKGPEWGCDTAGNVERAGKVIHGLGLDLTVDDRNSIVVSAENSGADSAEANSLIDQALQLTDSELVKTIASACDAAEQL